MPKEIMGITTYTADEAAALLGVTRRTLMNYITGGKMAGSKIGGRWAFTEKQLRDFINQGSVIDKRPGMVGGFFEAASKPRKKR